MMNRIPLPFSASLGLYERQAEELLAGHRSGDPEAIEIFHHKHPRFLDEKIPWLPKDLEHQEIRTTALTLEDAQLAVARVYDFHDWPALVEYVQAVTAEGSEVFQFESAVEAVVDGDVATLRALLRENPGLARARSTRVTHFDPPVHRATLLHYVAANGVEGYRQRTPANAVEIARVLLEAGADANGLADLYGGACTVMSMLVSSCHPAQAGVQEQLVELLLDFGATVEPAGVGKWRSPLTTALAFGYGGAAETLARRGARIDNVVAAAGLGRLDELGRMLPSADAESRQAALAIAASHGRVEALKVLLDAGEDPNRYNPDGFHAHSTPLHQAALAGHEAAVRLLVERGAKLDIKDTIYHSTPLGWAEHGGQTVVAEYLRSR